MSERPIPSNIRRAVVVFLSLYVLAPAAYFGFVYATFQIDLELGPLFRAMDNITRILS